MGTPRSGHTAVRLLDGRVLVVGGSGAESEPSSAELYDPATGTWSATGSMLKPHAGFRATLLRDGKVLLGDVDPAAAGGSTLESTGAEVYDPASGTWTLAGKIVWYGSPALVRDAEATLLLDGRVLVTGPHGAELYDPDTGTWAATQKMVAPPAQHAATLLPDGTVLVVKGDHALVSAELYDPAAGTWVPIANMHGSYNGVTAMLLPDGMVLVAGGTFDGDLSAELYDTATGAWTAVGPMAAVGGSATLLSDGRVLVSGRDGSELYDPGLRSWEHDRDDVAPTRRRPGHAPARWHGPRGGWRDGHSGAVRPGRRVAAMTVASHPDPDSDLDQTTRRIR